MTIPKNRMVKPFFKAFNAINEGCEGFFLYPFYILLFSLLFSFFYIKIKKKSFTSFTALSKTAWLSHFLSEAFLKKLHNAAKSFTF